ncbi:hypothetical protein Tco_1181417, partial [Tanacetum coccineum]
ANNNIKTASDGNNTNNVNVVNSTINVVIAEVNVVDPKTSIELPNDPNIPKLEDIVYSDDDEDVGAEADMNNLNTFMPVSQFLKELRENTFSGSDNEDANEHIEKVLEIVDLFHDPNITQEPDESLYQAWERFKELSMKCPQYCLTEMRERVDFVLNGLDVPTRQILDSRKEEVLRLLTDWLLQAQLNNLGKEIKKENEKVYAIQVGCEQCKGPHYSKDCSLKEKGKTLEEAYYTQFGGPFQGGGYRATTPRRPFLSTVGAKIDVCKIKITLRVGEENIIFKNVKPASSIIRRVYMLSLRERMELDLEARLMEWTLVLNRLLDPFLEDYIELNDLNEPFELRRNQGALMNVPIFVGNFSVVTDFTVLETMDHYRDEGMGDVIFGEPFLREVGINAKQFEGMITIYNGNDEVTYQMVRSHPRFKYHTNEQCNKIPPLLMISEEDKMNGISHPYQKLKGFYKRVLNLRPDYIRDAKMEEWLTREHISVHEME